MPTVAANGIELFFEQFGASADPAVVLVAGLGAHSLSWDDEFCADLAGRGHRVVRFDNRDNGLSTHVGPDESYTLSDMAADTRGLLDALDLGRVHLVGRSMGGMVAQQLAIEAPERVRTLTSVMSSTGEPGVADPDPGLLAALLEMGEPVADRDAAIERGLRLARLWGSPELFDEDYARRLQEATVDRGPDPAGVARQAMAVVASGSREAGLRRLRIPTLVIHGDADRLVPATGGRRTAELVSGARYEEIPGMGHDLPPALWGHLVDLIAGFIATTIGS